MDFISACSSTYLVELQPLAQTAGDAGDEEFIPLLLFHLLKHDTAYILKQLVDVQVHLVQVISCVCQTFSFTIAPLMQ